MTISLKQELLRLLTRRTRLARENANRDLQELLRILKIIKKAGKAGECSVQLPADVTGTIVNRINRTRLLTYVLGVTKSTRARQQRRAVLEAAEQQLTREIENRRQVYDGVLAKIESLKRDFAGKKEALKRDFAGKKEAVKAAAEIEKDRASSRVFALEGQKQLAKLHNDAGFWDWIFLWVGCGLVVFVVVGLFSWLVSFLAKSKGNPWGSSFLFCGMPVLLIGGAVSAARLLWVWSLYSDRDRQVRAIKEEVRWDLSELNRKLSTKLAELEETLPTKLAELEETLSSARARENKARAALDWLKAQTGA